MATTRVPNSSSSQSPPPWQVLLLVANHLDAKTLSVASCVCKSWSIAMSSDDLWQPLCRSDFPLLANLQLTDPTVPYHRLYALGCAAIKRRLQKPMKPILSLDSITFVIDVYRGRECLSSIIAPGNELGIDKNGFFRFDIDVDEDKVVVCGESGDLRIVWNVILKGLSGVFTMMDCRGKGTFVSGFEGWFSEELPTPGCCSSGGPSGLVADLRFGLVTKDGKTMVKKASVGVLSIVTWRYICIDDSLRYLQHFLLPS